MNMIERISAYIAQNEAGGRARPDLLTPRQARRAGRKLRRDERLSDLMADSFIASITPTAEEPLADPVELTRDAALAAVDSFSEAYPRVAETAAELPVEQPAPCPRCGATVGACTTPSGTTTKTHKGREL